MYTGEANCMRKEVKMRNNLIVIMCLCVLGTVYGEDLSFKDTSVVRPARSVCPVTGTKLVVTDKTLSYVDVHNITYYFLNEEAKNKFLSSEWKYSKEMLTCQVCGEQTKKIGRGRVVWPESRYEGKQYFFCSMTHKSEFDKEPKKYIKGSLYIMTHKPKTKVKPVEPSLKKKPLEKLATVTPEVTPEIKLETEVIPEVKPEEVNQETKPATEEVTSEKVPAPEVKEEAPIAPMEETTK